jgi:hypothetical protein
MSRIKTPPAKTRRGKTTETPASRQRTPRKKAAKVTTPHEPSPVVASPSAAKGVDQTIADAFASWKAGAQISTLAGTIGVKRSKLRRNFIALAGGKPAFKSLRESGAGGSAEPFGGKRATGGRIVGTIATAHDDSRVPRTDHMRASEGWSVRRVWKPVAVEIKEVGRITSRELVATVHISPDGDEYVKARASEPADLIYESSEFTGRFRRYEESKLGKKLAKDEREAEKTIERGEHAIKRTRERKRKAKLARKVSA